MRTGVLATLLALSAAASADPSERFETSGFFGLDYFGDRIGLGDSVAPEQIPQTSPVFGARLTYVLARARYIELGTEGEIAFAPAWTGYGFEGPRMSYFSPVFGWRGSLMLRLRGLPILRPHVLAGAGGETVLSSSPFMKKETDPIFYYGVGATFPMSPRWQMRIDGRQGFMPARDGGQTSTFEVQVAIGATFGLATKPVPQRVEVADDKPAAPVAADIDKDTDGDGIPDRLDQCPNEPELVNGIEDGDGCPEPDPDGDGIIGAADKCPDQAEDFDHFQDDDGCPEADNDSDGIPDAKDACPNEAETRNGIDDEDGCPDQLPDNIAAAFATASAVKFEAGKARLSTAAKASLEKTLVVLRDHPQIKVLITAHPEKADTSGDIAKKRADNVKGYLIEQGAGIDQLQTAIGDPQAPKGPTIELSVPVKK